MAGGGDWVTITTENITPPGEQVSESNEVTLLCGEIYRQTKARLTCWVGGGSRLLTGVPMEPHWHSPCPNMWPLRSWRWYYSTQVLLHFTDEKLEAQGGGKPTQGPWVVCRPTLQAG